MTNLFFFIDSWKASIFIYLFTSSLNPRITLHYFARGILSVWTSCLQHTISYNGEKIGAGSPDERQMLASQD